MLLFQCFLCALIIVGVGLSSLISLDFEELKE